MDNQQTHFTPQNNVTPPMQQPQPPQRPQLPLQTKQSNKHLIIGVGLFLVAASVVATGTLMRVSINDLAKQQQTVQETSENSSNAKLVTQTYEDSIKKDAYQAVFLSDGQVYFGKITSMNTAFTEITDIYYLRTGQEVQGGTSKASTDVSLAKLGSELHGPEDKMIIATQQITFVENLKASGNVTSAIMEYKKSN